ncbi:hypothetical protein OJF2_29110 [Aquisphaera giovannonii]|uniref:Uncharacterized protein n=1 Tax=Aquisphaera giovannonii TaxID=406548 RepID=A0A5B9W146_9BACT|nr:hypothetical protein [Aquisphaera giovannonii]QEH34372.1 hypothetical protein OJF2_29110 [Aquisphaera giovannonii]
MELHEALTQITEIRQQMARTEVFRGYRAVPAAFSGLVAIGAGWIQSAFLTDPTQQLPAYLALWIGAAVVSGASAAFEMLVRARNSGSPLTRELTHLAIEQFCPCLVAGSLLTVVIARSAPEAAWILPGIWQVLYSLGIFASCRLLPRPTAIVAAFYMLCGLAVLGLARGEHALSPWAMGFPFGAGQLLAAAVLYRTLERAHAS